MAQKFKITLPSIDDQPNQELLADVRSGGSRQVVATFDGADQTPQTLPVDQDELELVVDDGVEFSVRASWVDDAGNVGPPLVGPTNIAADTTAPPAPTGQIGVENIGET